VLAQLAGDLSPEEARGLTERATRRFVRRQRSWFRRDPAVRWFDAGAADLLEQVTGAAEVRTIGA
jgi:tRNA dimethylallyltransferase